MDPSLSMMATIIVRGLTTLLNVLFMPIEVDLHIMGFSIKVIGTF